MHVLFCCDDPAYFSPDKDTTRALIEMGWQRGHAVSWADKHQLAWLQGCVQVCSTLLLPGADDGWFTPRPGPWHSAMDFDAVVVRNDPPVDLPYQRMCQLLALLPAGRVWNAPGALLTHNEKLCTLRFASWMIDTIVEEDEELHARFVSKSLKGVSKSLDSLGGDGVVAWGGGFGPAQAAREKVAHFGPQGGARSMTMSQGWIDRVYSGDKRVIMIDGHFAGVVLRVPRQGEFRGNIHLGGQVEPSTLTDREEAIVSEVGPWLRQEGILLAGLDLVGEYLTEINITSPTGMREIERLSSDRPTQRFWDALERRQIYK